MCTSLVLPLELEQNHPKTQDLFEASVNLVEILNFNVVVCLLLQLLMCEFSR